MSLPILESPKYTTIIPSTGVSVEYRPFLVKEEKILMMAQETDKPQDMVNAMKDVVKACTFNKVDPNQLTTFDLEYIFLKLRTKAVGEKSTVGISCSKCDTANKVEIDLDSIQAPNIDQTKYEIMLTDTVGIKMRYIRVKDLTRLSDTKKSKVELVADTVIASIQSIFDEKGIYNTDDSSKEELTTFINSLNRSQMKKIEDFIESMPQIKHEVEFTCTNPECNHENKLTISGVQSFFE